MISEKRYLNHNAKKLMRVSQKVEFTPNPQGGLYKALIISKSPLGDLGVRKKEAFETPS